MATPLLSQCVQSDGIGTEGNSELAMEQLALAVDVIAFHVRQCKLVARHRLVCCDSSSFVHLMFSQG